MVGLEMFPIRIESRPRNHLRSWTAKHGLGAVLFAFACLLATPAIAQDPPPDAGEEGLESSLAIVELYVTGQAFPKTTEYVNRVSEELGQLTKYALLDREDARRLIQEKMTTSTSRVTDDKLKRIENLVKKGDSLAYTDPRKAIEILGEAKTELKTIMETISINHRLRKEYFRTQMLLARSHHDNANKEKAAEIMEEIIRVFGDEASVTEEDYHPDIVALFRETFRRLSEQKRGSLTVRTDPPGAEVIINGKVQERPSPASYEGLYTGSVSVSARIAGRESMIHRVEIGAEKPTELMIDIDYETAMAFDDERFGFEFVDIETLKRRLADFASRIGEVLKVDYVLVAGLVEMEGRTYLEGYLVNVDKQTIERQQAFYTKANVVSNNRVVQMASFVADKSFKPPGPSVKPWYTNWIGWTVGGVAAVSGILALVFHMDFQSGAQQFNRDYSDGACVDHLIAGAPQLVSGSYNKSFCNAIMLDKELAEEKDTVAGAMAGVAGAALVGSVLLFILLQEEDESTMASSEEFGVPSLQYASPTVMPGGGPGFGLGISF